MSEVQLPTNEISSQLPTHNWQKRRPEQGYSYLEVLRELKRRMRGDYLLPAGDRLETFQVGGMRVATQFYFAAVFSDLLKEFELTHESFLSLMGCVEDDTAGTLLACILDPYAKHEGVPISVDSQVDEVFPGRTVTRSV